MTTRKRAGRPAPEAGPGEPAPAEAAPPPGTGEPAGNGAAEAVVDENRRRYREALERKQGRSAGGRQPHDPDRSVTPVSNTKRQRTFRRKSGG